MKKYTIYLVIILQGLTQYGFSQDVSASTGWNYVYNRVGATPGGNLITMKSSMGAVCNSASANVLNYNNYYNLQIAPGGLPKFGDSANIQAAAKSIANQSRFKAEAGKPVTLSLTLLLPIPGRLNSDNPFYNSTINGNITGRIGIDVSNKENVKNKLYDNTITFSKDSMATDPLFRRYYCTGEVIFKRGSTTGYVFITIPVTNYTGQVVYEEFVVPYIVSGPLDEQVKIIGVTTEPQIPYMVLHDPPGDGSTATLEKTTRSCRTLEESYARDTISNIFNTVKFGVSGSTGFIGIVELNFEIFAEFSSGQTNGKLRISSNSSENCISITENIRTSDLAPDTSNKDLFIGYGMDLSYAISESLRFTSCPFIIDTGLIFSPVNGTMKQFMYTKKDILADIQNKKAALATQGFTSRDSAKAQYQINVWNQVLALNDSNITYATGSQEINFPAGTEKDYKQTVESSVVKSITVEHYIENDNGLLNVVNIGGSGFSGGKKFTTSKRFGSMGSASNLQSQTIGYKLNDNDVGDFFNLRIKTDPMYGTAVFEILNGTKTSCPYEGGIQRDQPKLSIVGIASDTIVFPNVKVDSAQSFELRICNQSAEERDYRLRLVDNNNSAIVTANGNNGPEFYTVTGTTLAAGACRNVRVIVNQPQNAYIPYSYLFKFELVPRCDDGISESVFGVVNFGDLVKSKSGGYWSNPETWEARRVPQPTDNVIINSDHIITIPDTVEFRCKTLTLKPGASVIAAPGTKLIIKEN